MGSAFFYPSANGSGYFPLPTVPADRFTYLRGAISPTVGAGATVMFDNVTNNLAGTAFYSPSFGVSFLHHGSALELVFSPNGTSYLVKVDDEYVTLTPQSVGNSGTFYAKYDFGGSARRRIEVLGYNSAFNGVNVGPNDSLDPAPVRGPRVIVLGDSFAQAQPNGWTSALADWMGWDDVWASALGGTGYLADNSGTQHTYRGRVVHDVINYSPDIVIIEGSVNDDGGSYETKPTAIGAEAALLYAQIRAALPNALVFAGPTASGGVNKMTATKLAIKDAMKKAAADSSVIWIDTLELPISFANGTPIGGTLAAGYAAGAGGGDGIRLTNVPQAGSTIEIGSGATRERIQIKSFTQVGSNTYKSLFDGALQYAHSSGESWTQVGGSYLTGYGKVGAPTGFGNSDLLVSADGVHPSTEGYAEMGRVWADLLRQTMRATNG